MEFPADIIKELSDTVNQLQFEFFVGGDGNVFGGITKSDYLVHVFTESAQQNHLLFAKFFHKNHNQFRKGAWGSE